MRLYRSPALDAAILPPEGDALLVAGDQVAVGDGDTVSVTRQIGQHRLGATEWGALNRLPTRVCAAAPRRLRRSAYSAR
jgi:hypothetical protein